MKKILACLLFFSISLFAIDQEKEPKDFRGIEWGSDLRNNEKFIFKFALIGNSNVEMFIRRNDKKKIFAADINSINYSTYNNRFYMVSIESKGEKNYLELKKSFIATYGEFTEENQFLTWIFEKVQIKFKYDNSSKEISITYFYVPVMDEYMQAQYEKNKDNDRDL